MKDIYYIEADLIVPMQKIICPRLPPIQNYNYPVGFPICSVIFLKAWLGLVAPFLSSYYVYETDFFRFRA